MLDDFHMAHLNRYGSNLNGNIEKVAIFFFFKIGVPAHFVPMKTPKSYKWLESCGSHLSDGVKKQIYFCILQSVQFSRTLRTDIFLYTEKLSYHADIQMQYRGCFDDIQNSDAM